MFDLLKPVAIVAAGLFLLSMGVRSASGFESEVTHLYGGVDETVTCDDGIPVGGIGQHATRAKELCAEEKDAQRDRAPWWFVAGIVVSIYGVTRFKKARS